MAHSSSGTGGQHLPMGYAMAEEESQTSSGANQPEPQNKPQSSAFGLGVTPQAQPVLPRVPRLQPGEPAPEQYLPFAEAGSIQPLTTPYPMLPAPFLPQALTPDDPILWQLGGLCLEDPLFPTHQQPSSGSKLLALIHQQPGSGTETTASPGSQAPAELSVASGTVRIPDVQSVSAKPKAPADRLPSRAAIEPVATKDTTAPLRFDPDTIFLSGFEPCLLKHQFSRMEMIFRTKPPEPITVRTYGVIRSAYEKYFDQMTVENKLEFLAFHLTIAYGMMERGNYNEASTHLMLTGGCLSLQFKSRWGVHSNNCVKLSKFVSDNNSIIGIGARKSTGLSRQQQSQVDHFKKKAAASFALSHALRCQNSVVKRLQTHSTSSRHNEDSELAIKHFNQLQKDLFFIEKYIGKFEQEEDQAFYQEARRLADQYRKNVADFEKLLPGAKPYRR